MGAVTLYLPLSQFALETLYCWAITPTTTDDHPEFRRLESHDSSSDSDSDNLFECFYPSGALLWIVRLGSILTFLVVTIAIPIQTYLIIAKNKPVGSLEDPTHR